MYQNDLSIYSINDIDKLLDFDISTHKKRKGATYINAPFSFDIETSSFYQNEEKKATMYMWGFGINGKVIIGRTWKEFIDLIYKFSSKLGLNEDYRAIIWVHNLSYEFEWIMKRLPFDRVFALDTRQVCVAECSSLGIEFRCSYLLSGYSLNKLGNYLLKYQVKKLVGELDYSLVRGTQTPVTEEELNYLRNDNLVVMSYIQEYIERKKYITSIPLTKTGEVRRKVRNNCNKQYSNYRELMKKLTLTPNEFYLLNRAFQGGFTHANPIHSMSIVHNVTTNDFTSAYPSIMVLEKLPMSRGEKIKNPNKYQSYINDGFATLMTITFKNLENTKAYDDYISSSRCNHLEYAKINNGRVHSAKVLTITITDIDLKIIEKIYSWSELTCSECYYYSYGYLPKAVVDSVLSFYENKTKLKGVEGMEYDYMQSKELLNSCYGMCVTNPCRDTIEWSFEEQDNQDDIELWDKQPCDINDAIEKYNESKSRFLFYPWGVWITAKNRYNLWMGILECGTDYIYSDTDSIKLTNYEEHEKYFKSYNKNIIKKIQASAKHYKFKIDRYIPKTIKGVEKPIGVWDKEECANEFKTLGAKRYIYKVNGKYHLTCSGLNKSIALPYIESLGNPIKVFTDKLYIPKGQTGKLIHTYCDYPIEGVLTDYKGNKMEYYEESFIHLEQADYSLGISQEYQDFLFGITRVRMGRNKEELWD